eukprot:symbB.v1.2.018508.t1/scaffold1403.1/size153157/14
MTVLGRSGWHPFMESLTSATGRRIGSPVATGYKTGQSIHSSRSIENRSLASTFCSVVFLCRFVRPNSHRRRVRPQETPEVLEEVAQVQNLEMSWPNVFQRVLQPSLANGWILLGDMLTLSLAAPFLSTFYLRVGVLRPYWFINIADSEKDFIFPEFSHGVIFALCWCFGGLAMGAFQTDAVNPQNLLKTIQRTSFSGLVTAWLATVVRSVLFLSGRLEGAYGLTGYLAPSSHVMPSYEDFFIDLLFEVFLLVAWRFTAAVLFAPSPLEGEDEEEEEEEQANIDSKLLFGDLLVAGFITPAFLIEVFVKTKVYTPLWAIFWDGSDTGIWKPIFAHGSVLAMCWFAGAFVAGAYSKDAMAPIDLASILKRLWTAGIVATVLLAASNVLGNNLIESQQGFVNRLCF